MEIWFRKIGNILSLTSYLFETNPQLLTYPPRFGIRVSLLLFLGFSTIFWINVILLTLPCLKKIENLLSNLSKKKLVALGRYFVSLFTLVTLNDLTNFTIGFYFFWIVFKICSSIFSEITQNQPFTVIFQIAIKWIVLVNSFLETQPILFINPFQTFRLLNGLSF